MDAGLIDAAFPDLKKFLQVQQSQMWWLSKEQINSAFGTGVVDQEERMTEINEVT
jgi:hypothetical protein